MGKLNQILAVEKGVKTRTYKNLSDAYKGLQKLGLITGLTRSYTPKEDGGEELPSETTLIQLHVPDMIEAIQSELSEYWDITATKEWGNTTASSNVVLDDGTIIAEGVPVTYLLFLEKQLNDMHSFVSSIPVLDPAETWSFDDNINSFVTDDVETHRTRKVPKVIVKYPATTEHPAQTEMFSEDVIVGFWKTRKFSSAIPATKRKQMVERVEELQRAVKVAREEANSITVENQEVADGILDYIFPVSFTD